MGEQVKVTSLEALESFRASSIVFLAKAKRSVDQATDEVRRTRHWIDNDQRTLWEGQLKKRKRALEAAQQELLSARYSEFNDSNTIQKAAEKKAKMAVEEAENKLRMIKNWSRQYDGAVDPLVKKMEGLRQFLDHDFPKALAFLSQVQRTLDDYMHTPAQESSAPPSPTESASNT